MLWSRLARILYVRGAERHYVAGTTPPLHHSPLALASKAGILPGNCGMETWNLTPHV